MISVEQAVFGSAQTRTMRGYQMLAQSPGVNDALASELTPWAPTRQAMASDAESFESLNAFIAMEEWLVVSRTVYGRPEYSQRGDLETATRFLIVPFTALEGYDYNPLWFARTAMSLGHLRMYSPNEPSLETIAMPRESLIGVSTSPLSIPATDHLVRALQELANGNQVVLVGVEDERSAIDFILGRLPWEQRVRLSFTTGLRPSGLRPFQLHFLSEEAFQAERGISGRNLVVVNVAPPSLATR